MIYFPSIKNIPVSRKYFEDSRVIQLPTCQKDTKELKLGKLNI